MLPATADLDWLVGPLEPPAARLATRLELAGAAALAVGFWQVIGYTAPRIRAASRFAAAEELDLLDAIAHAVELHGVLQEQLLHRLAGALDEAGIPHVLLKGCAMRRVAYPRLADRGSWDIDLGVSRPDLGRTEVIVRRLGFAPAIRERPTGRFIPAPRLFRAVLESGHYELCTMVREAAVGDLDARDLAALADTRETLGSLLWDVRGGAWIARTAVDIHHGMDDEVPLAPVLATSQRVDGLSVPSRPWMVVHAARTLHRELRREGTRVLHHLCDLCRLLPADIGTARALADALPIEVGAPLPALADALRAGPVDTASLLRICSPGTLSLAHGDAG